MVEIMVSKRPWRVYDDYLKNSRYYLGIALLSTPLLSRYDLDTAYYCCGGSFACERERWRVIARLLWGLSEHGGGKHPLGNWLDSDMNTFHRGDCLSGLFSLTKLNGAIHHDNRTQTLHTDY